MTLTPIKAIRQNCLNCMCGQRKEVQFCPSNDCPLYDYRMGHNPSRKGKGGKNIHHNEPVVKNSSCIDENQQEFDSDDTNKDQKDTNK